MEERDLQLRDGSTYPINWHKITITALDDRRSCANCKIGCEKMGLALVKVTSHPMHYDGRYHVIDLATRCLPQSVHRATIYKRGFIAFQIREEPLESGEYWIGYDPGTVQIFIERI